MTREQVLAKKTREKHRQEKMRESFEAAKGPVDLPFLLLVFLLLGVGLVMVLSASFPSAYYETGNPMKYFWKQAVFAGLGIVFMLVIGKMNYQRFRRFSLPVLGLAVILLALVALTPLGITHNNATRWLGFGGFQFQPSEVAKLAVVMFFADNISKKKDKMRSLREGIIPYTVILLFIAGLMMMEPHLSGTILILGTGAVMMLVGGIEWKWVGGALGAAAALGYMIIGVAGYGASRIAMWKDPWIDAQDKGYQMVQSLLAIGSGGLLGVGLGKSRQKFLYLPEEHNDFIFSICCEELGLIGATLIMFLFAALILRGYWIALHARDRFGSLLVVGVVTLIAMQTFLNIGVVTGLLPATGISLPFFSYGGTALLIQLCEVGVVLSVSRQMKPTKAG